MCTVGSLKGGAGPYRQGQAEGRRNPTAQALESPLFNKCFHNSCQCNFTVCNYTLIAIKYENVRCTYVPQWAIVPLQRRNKEVKLVFLSQGNICKETNTWTDFFLLNIQLFCVMTLQHRASPSLSL